MGGFYMDLEKEVLDIYSRNKKNPEFKFIKGNSPYEGAILKEFPSFTIGLELELENNKRKYSMNYNNNILIMEITDHGDYKDYSSFQMQLDGKTKKEVTKTTFKRYYERFREVMKTFELIGN